MSHRTILVVEDDPSIRRGIVDTLACGGFETIECADGEQGLSKALAVDIDLALVDIRLPRRDGFSLVMELRKSKPSLPVIFVTALGSEPDRLKGLQECEADDYLIKNNFGAKELIARVEAVLRRSAERPRTVGMVTLDNLEVDLERREVRHSDGRTETIAVKEAELLQYLASARGRPVSREELLQRVWGLDPKGVETRTIDMHIARLRQKLGESDPIRTVRGQGYMLS